jgi:hypothetical protein
MAVNKFPLADNHIVGGTDGTTIGNVSDSLKVSVSNSAVINVVSQDSAQYYCENNSLYSIGLDLNMAAAGTDNPLVLMRNPTGSGKKIAVWRVQCGSTVTNVGVEFKIFSSPTVTANGSSVTVYPRNVNNAQAAAVALITSLPTISASGNPLSFLSVGQNSNSIIFADDFSLYLQPNSSILITGSPSSNNRNASLTIVWAEVT